MEFIKKLEWIFCFVLFFAAIFDFILKLSFQREASKMGIRRTKIKLTKVYQS